MKRKLEKFMFVKAVLGGIVAITIGIIVISLPSESSEPTYVEIISQTCTGDARCYSGTVTDVIDGDTIRVEVQSIRFALASTPELHEFGGIEAKNFVESICPVGSDVIVDEDDLQTGGSYGRILAVVHCNGYNLNQAVLDSGFGEVSTNFCDTSEFGNSTWAIKYGC